MLNLCVPFSLLYYSIFLIYLISLEFILTFNWKVGELFLICNFFPSSQHFLLSNCHFPFDSPSSSFSGSILNSMSFDFKFDEFFYEYQSGFTETTPIWSCLVLTLRRRFPRYVFIRAKDFVTLLTKSILARYTVCKIDVVNISIYIYYDVKYSTRLAIKASSAKPNRGACPSRPLDRHWGNNNCDTISPEIHRDNIRL